MAYRATKSGFFPGFCLGFTEIVRPIKKMQNISDIIDNVFLLSLTEIAQNPYFSSFSV